MSHYAPLTPWLLLSVGIVSAARHGRKFIAPPATGVDGAVLSAWAPSAKQIATIEAARGEDGADRQARDHTPPQREAVVGETLATLAGCPEMEALRRSTQQHLWHQYGLFRLPRLSLQRQTQLRWMHTLIPVHRP